LAHNVVVRSLLGYTNDAFICHMYSGEAMKEKDISIAHVYASPSLRCVESAYSLLQGQLNMSGNCIMLKI